MAAPSRCIATDGDNYDPANPAAPEYGWKLGTSGTTAHPATVTLLSGTVLQFDKSAYLKGVGTITGAGSVRLSGGHLEARVTINVPLQTTATTNATMDKVSHVDTWSPTIIGEHGEVTLTKVSSVAPGPSLQIEGGDSVTVASGGSLTVPGTATVTSGGCCVNPAKLTVNSGGTLTLGSASGTALINWIALGGCRTPAPRWRLAVVRNGVRSVQPDRDGHRSRFGDRHLHHLSGDVHPRWRVRRAWCCVVRGDADDQHGDRPPAGR